jgi:hypothetical protein
MGAWWQANHFAGRGEFHMNVSKLPQPVSGSARSLPTWLASAALCVSLAYVGAAVVTAPGVGTVIKGLLFPLRLFLIASAPMIGGIAFHWADKAISGARRRRLACVLLVLLWAFGAIAFVSVLPW